MKKKYILLGCIVLALVLITVVIGVSGKKKNSEKGAFFKQHTTESETDVKIEDEAPLKVVKPKDDKRVDTDKQEPETGEQDESESKPIELPFVPVD